MNKFVKGILISCYIAQVVVAIIGMITAIISQQIDKFFLYCVSAWVSTIIALVGYARYIIKKDW